MRGAVSCVSAVPDGRQGRAGLDARGRARPGAQASERGNYNRTLPQLFTSVYNDHITE